MFCLYCHSVEPLHYPLQVKIKWSKNLKRLFKNNRSRFTLVCLYFLGFNTYNLKVAICIAVGKRFLQMKISKHGPVHTRWHSAKSPLWVWIELLLILCQCTAIFLGRCYSFKNSISLNIHWRKCAEREDNSLNSIIAIPVILFLKRERKRDNDELGKQYLCFFFFFNWILSNKWLFLPWLVDCGAFWWHCQMAGSDILFNNLRHPIFWGKKHTSIASESEEFLCTEWFLEGGPE